MCGIIGYVGKRDASSLLINGLERLTYRGYDSAGVATTSSSNLEVKKGEGKMKDLKEELDFDDMEGKTGVGHCLHPDTEVCTSSGLTKINKIDGEEVVSADLDELKTKNGREQKLTKHKSPKYLYKISTSFSEFKCTGRHRVFVSNGDKVKEKRVQEIRKDDDLIAVPKKLPHNPKGNEIEFEDVYIERHYKIDDDLSKELRKKREEKNLTRAEIEERTGVKINYIQRIENRTRNSFEEKRWEKVKDIYTIDLKDRAELTYTNPTKFPNKPSKELLQIIGYHLGDGYFASDRNIRYKDERESILEEYKKLYRKTFNVDGKIYDRGNHSNLCIYSKFLVDWFEKNIPTLFYKTGNEEIPNFAFKLNKEKTAALLRGLFDAEGSVGVNARTINFRVTSKKLVDQTQYLLFKFGILSTKSKNIRNQENWNNVHNLQINDLKSMKKFKKLIGFSAKDKMEKIDEIMEKSKNLNFKYFSCPYNLNSLIKKHIKETKTTLTPKNSFCTDLRLNNIREKVNNEFVKEKLSKYLKSDIIWARFDIEKIESDTDYVYDLEVEEDHNFIGDLAIQHNSRWATHGEVNDKNAHPHTDCKNELAVVHNGIIENYESIKQKLSSHEFSSETDTEVIPHLIEEKLKEKNSFQDAFLDAINELNGSFAVAAAKEGEDRLLVARNKSPLVIGLGDGENFVASDIPAFLEHTDKVIVLEDGEIGEITQEEINVMDLDGEAIDKEVKKVDWEAEEAEKGGFEHYMLKEIYEQPNAIRQTITGRINQLEGEVELKTNLSQRELREIDGIQLIGCGTSYHAGLFAKYLFEEIAEIPAEITYSSEYRYKNNIKDNYLTIAITQSGETADTLGALREAKSIGSKTLAVTNVLGSTVTREAKHTLYIKAGPEIGVAASKTFTSQMTTLILLAIYLANIKDTINKEEAKKILGELKDLPGKIQSILDNSDEIEKLSKEYLDSSAYFFIGRHVNYPVALEGALKLKEISYKHAEGFPGGELKHGPLALVNEKTPVFALATKGKTYEKILSNIKEVEARDSPVIAVANKEDEEIDKYATETLKIPPTHSYLSPILSTVALQLFAYYTANKLNRSIDTPQHLAKAVSVE
ncbi:glutamine--fructose-6-phosphate transaminase (isomerizing) [archaeon SCG-AAA382B04]|nr:glutamine--fructose-6-phosphate transaminase (isomerizing) [archaeon SCG-AAA382B04]